MDALTWLSLGLQLAALCSIVGALLLYLLRKVRSTEAILTNSAKTVLITSADTALGLQIATYLSSRGWRVIAGCKSNGLGARLASSWAAAHAGSAADAGGAAGGVHVPPPRLATIELDVAREDLLEAAARATAQHLPAGEHGVWAVINTAGSAARGAACWEGVLRANVLGALRVARTFAPLLSAAAAAQPHAGRLFYIGLTADTDAQAAEREYATAEAGESAAAAAASRWAVWGAAGALRGALRARAVHVAVLHAPDLAAAALYAPPALLSAPSATSTASTASNPSSAANSRPETPSSDSGTVTGSCSVTMPGEAAEYSAKVLPTAALRTLEDALTTPSPRNSYYLKVKPDSWFTRVPSLRMSH